MRKIQGVDTAQAAKLLSYAMRVGEGGKEEHRFNLQVLHCVKAIEA
jgi:hypothetical protein